MLNTKQVVIHLVWRVYKTHEYVIGFAPRQMWLLVLSKFRFSVSSVTFTHVCMVGLCLCLYLFLYAWTVFLFNSG